MLNNAAKLAGHVKAEATLTRFTSEGGKVSDAPTSRNCAPTAFAKKDCGLHTPPIGPRHAAAFQGRAHQG